MIKGLNWVGIRTERFVELVTFYREAMGLEVDHEENDFVVFKLPDGSKVEVFGPSDQDHLHFDSGPVAGCDVDDVEAARERLEAGGAEFIGAIQHWEPTGEAWSHFRGPDGNVYELTQKGRRS
jgi:catechol 2,3-dioxygenase-like lactoylglutathione lyase family enzyme